MATKVWLVGLLSFLCFLFMEVTANFDGDEWSVWSEFSSCSRTCGGGVTQQFRKCIAARGCHGPCSETRDFRNEQCQKNNMDYKDWTRVWEAVEDPENPCTLICRVVGTDMYAKKTPKIRDGTRCKSGSLSVCIDSKCESVGCDLKIGSPKKVDLCGVCGGNGSSCSTPIYRWEIIPNGPCTDSRSGAAVTCGGGHQSVKVICRNSLTMEKVDNFLCHVEQKPKNVQSCSQRPCEPEWQVGEWTPCSSTCNEGTQQRKVFCAQEKNGTKITLPDSRCHHSHKPPTTDKCFVEPCPFYTAGAWSSCSTSCGKGYKTRSVTCRSATNQPATNCRVKDKPADTKPCSEMPCPSTSTTTTTMSTTTTTITSTSKSFAPTVTIVATKVSTPPNGKKPGRRKTTMRVEISSTQSPMPTAQPKYQYRSNVISNYLVYPTTAANDDDALEDFPQEHTLPLIQPYPPLDNNNFGQNSMPSEPTFVAEEWGPCTSPHNCGAGVRTRDVRCKIFLEFSRTIATLPDKECPGPKPADMEPCSNLPCPSTSENLAIQNDWQVQFPRDAPGKVAGLPPGINLNVDSMSFSWKVLGYSQCSAVCLGGTQEAIVQCVRDYDGRVATPVLCMDKPQPEIPTTRTCNDHVCLPRWNVSDFGACSKNCGGGVMTRQVVCIKEVTRGNEIIVPNGVCAPPIPRTEMLCNTVNCPPFWEPGDWSRCSKECGVGKRTRQIHCKQIIALGQVVEWSNPEGHCMQPKPIDQRACNKKACGNRKMQTLSPTPFTYIQSEWKKKLSLTVKGEAKVFHEVSPLRMHCPAGKDVDRSRVYWMKGHEFVADLLPKLNRNNKNKIQILSKNAVLKIHNLTYSDSGIYTCLVNNRPISNLTLTVVPFVGSRELRSSNREQQLADQQVASSADHHNSHHHHESSNQVLLPTPRSNLFLASSSSAAALKAPFSFLRDKLVLLQRIFIV